ncbi:MAG: DUF6206 family protein [bacterium]
MDIDYDLLVQFEKQLVPHDLSRSGIAAEVLGYGEISSIFSIAGRKDIIYKRLPIFSSVDQAEGYKQRYFEYCDLLKQAGLSIPEDDAAIVEIPGRPVVIYFVQRRFAEEQVCHKLIHKLARPEIEAMLVAIMGSIEKTWQFNHAQQPAFEIAVDAQLSNWVWVTEAGGQKLYLLDTTTPMYRVQGVEQLDVELFLESIPFFIRWLVRRLDLDDVVNRYYDPVSNLTDLVANLYKEQRPDLIPFFIETINGRMPEGVGSLSRKEIDDYYKEDKMIWTLLSILRRTDRFITTKILRRRYEFILPGKVNR